jgi:GT2 family glycosyltransferase
MHWFLKTFIVPLLDALRPAVIVEVGVELGTVTKPLLEWSRANSGAVVHSIDPSPKLEVDALLAEYGELLHFHRIRSLEVLSQIEDVDLALIDGDHNWYTVINELRELELRARADGRSAPVILLHDIGWPYGRRDLYYDPQSIPAAHRQPHSRRGIVPGRAELAPGGVNAHLENAELEGTPANGVLTAAEDFVAESQESWRLFSIPGLSGLGVLVTTATLAEHEPVRVLLDSIEDPSFLRTQCEAIEQARLQSEVRRAGLTRKLAKAELQLQAVDPEDLPELEDRAALLGAQLSVVAELEEQLGDALAKSAGRVLGSDLSADEEERKAADGRVDQAEPESSGPHTVDTARDDDAEGQEQRPELAGSLSVALSYRLQLASAARERLEAELRNTQASLRGELERARAELTDAIDARERLRHELSELRVETQLLDTQRERLQSKLARAGGDMQIAYAERDALRRHLEELTANETYVVSAPDEQERLRMEQDIQATSRERNELIRALASWRACPWWEREIEQQGRQAFLESYLPLLESAPAGTDVRDPLALPIPTDYESLLVGPEQEQESDAPSVDVVVCIHDALQDVRRCLSSLLALSARRFRLILVDDGSAAQTRTWLNEFVERHRAVTLIEREAPHGYTLAANAGLRASDADYVVLLNSDTIVSPGWLGRLVAHGERNPRVGILGPISNAASHQSVPALRENGAWATNPLPDWLTVEGMALIVERAEPRADARLPFINGFCYVVKREVIDAIGYLDEERFAEGYCEENDFSHRAYRRGFALGVADDAYVYHAKSRSFGVEGRDELAKRHYQTFLEKHDRDEIERLVSEMEADRALAPLREAVARASTSPAAIAPLLSGGGRVPLEVVFLLPGLAEGGSGGSHSIYQEVLGMRDLGISARIVLPHTAWERARSTYDNAEDVFEVFSDEQDLAARTSKADVISATHFKSVALLGRLRELREDFLAAYYVQDYEPFFTSSGEADLEEALASYTALDDVLMFAKTHWLCNVVGARHGVRVHKVEPSIDERLFRPLADGERDERPVRILAMIRPRTPRRQPSSTITLLEQLLKQMPGQVEVRTFGCRHVELTRFTRSAQILDGHMGVLSRRAVAEQMRHADVFLDMSMYQAFGRTALEAMACGCTAVVPSVGGVWEFVEHEQNALALDTFDLDRCFDELAALIGDRVRLRGMQSSARACAERFSILRAALSEYLLFEREHRRRLGPAHERLVLAATPSR